MTAASKVLADLQSRLNILKKQEAQPQIDKKEADKNEEDKKEAATFLNNLEKARLCAQLHKPNLDDKHGGFQADAQKYYAAAIKSLPRKFQASKTLQIELFATELILNAAGIIKPVFTEEKLKALANIDKLSPGLITLNIVQHLKVAQIKNPRTNDTLADIKDGFTEPAKVPAIDIAALNVEYREVVASSFAAQQAKPVFLYKGKELITVERHIVRDFINRNLRLLSPKNENLEVSRRLTFFEWSAWKNNGRGATDHAKCTALDCLSNTLQKLNNKQTMAEVKQGLSTFFKDFLSGKIKDNKGQDIDIVKLIEHNNSNISRAIGSLFASKRHHSTNTFAAFINVFREAEIDLNPLFNTALNAADNSRKPQIKELEYEYFRYIGRVSATPSVTISLKK